MFGGVAKAREGRNCETLVANRRAEGGWGDAADDEDGGDDVEDRAR